MPVYRHRENYSGIRPAAAIHPVQTGGRRYVRRNAPDDHLLLDRAEVIDGY